MRRQADQSAYRFRLDELFVWTVVAAIYALAVRWAMQHLFGWLAVAFVGAAIGMVLRRRWSRSHSIFSNGVIGGTMGCIVGNCSAGIVAGASTTIPIKLHEAAGFLFVACLFGVVIGSLFGVVFAFFFEEFCTMGRMLKKRKEQ